MQNQSPNEARRFRVAAVAAGVSYAEVAKHLGTGRKYVSAAARSDKNGKRVSTEQWRRIWDALMAALRDIGG